MTREERRGWGRFRVAAAGLWVAAAAAGAPAPEAAPVNAWWPLRAGNVWEFDVQSDSDWVFPNLPREQERRRGHGERRGARWRRDFAGLGPILEIAEVVRQMPVGGGEEEEWTALYFYGTQADGVYLYAHIEVDAPLRLFDRPMRVLPATVTAGTKWACGDLFIEGYQVALTAEVVGFESVTTPAGKFDGCAKVRYQGPTKGRLEYEDTAFDLKSGTFDRVIWFAKAIGPVKWTETVRAEVRYPEPGTYRVNSVYSEILTGFQVKP